MDQSMLFYTAVPILIGGSPGAAGRLASKMYTRHGVTAHWFGQGWHPLLSVYAKRHPISVSLTETNDRVWISLLLGLEQQERHTSGILCLITVSEDARLFLERTRELLEEHFVILSPVERGEDPLNGLVHSH